MTERFSTHLERWLRGRGPHTIAGLSDVFQEKSFAVVFVLLMFLPALPLPTGGVTHVFEIVTMLLAGELAAGRRTIWLPKRWRKMTIPTNRKFISAVVGRIGWLERFSSPRLGALLRNPAFRRLFGVIVFALALAAFVAPPFSGLDTLPSLGVVVTSLAIILEDFLVWVAGLVIGIIGVGVEIALGTAIFESVRHLF